MTTIIETTYKDRAPYHHMSKGCSFCRKILVECETNDYNDQKYQRVMDRIGIKEFCDSNCKLQYMLKKLGGGGKRIG